MSFSIGQQMLLVPGVLKEKLEKLNYPCQTTMQLMDLVISMTSFDPSDRPDFNQVYQRFLSIKEKGKCQGKIYAVAKFVWVRKYPVHYFPLIKQTFECKITLYISYQS